MKVALCFSGNIRDLDETKTFWLDFIEKYDADVYASFWDVENFETNDTINNFEKIYTPKRLEIENYEVFKKTTQDIASYHINPPVEMGKFVDVVTRPFGHLPMYYKVWRANLLTKQLGIEYDLVIRARTDIVLDEKFELKKNNYLNVPMGKVSNYVFTDNFGMNDCFAYAIPKIMDYYSFIYLKLMEYVNEGHYAFPPEHLLSVHFSKIKVTIREFPNYILITRVSKKMPHEIYNRFIPNPIETIYQSDEVNFVPDVNGTFYKKSIKDDFIV